MTLIQTVAAARTAGAVITRDGDRLVVRGPATVQPYARALIARKEEVLTLVDLLTGKTTALDWHSATVATKPGRCVLCGGEAILLDPYDRKPIHKVCADQALTQATATITSEGAAA